MIGAHCTFKELCRKAIKLNTVSLTLNNKHSRSTSVRLWETRGDTTVSTN